MEVSLRGYPAAVGPAGTGRYGETDESGPTPERRSAPGDARAKGLPARVSAHGHWLGIGIASLPGSIVDATRYPHPVTVANAVSMGLSTLGELTGTFNTSGSKALARFGGGALTAGAAIGVGLSVDQVASDAQNFARNPQSERARWRLANSGLQAGINTGALAATPFFPPAALIPLFVPDIGEAVHANQLHSSEQALRQQGLTTEAQAIHQCYVDASLNAAPVVNWFQSFYGDRIRPVIEAFEASQQNYDGAPPAGELPAAARTDPRVVDYYGTAMRERLEVLKNAQQGYLADLARSEGKDSVTLIAHAPQMFTWPGSGKPMRVFDRAVALTWSRDTGAVTGTFFAADADGVFRLPTLNEGVPQGARKQNLVIVSDQPDDGRQPVKFDLAAYRALPPGNVVFRDPKGYAWAA